MANMRNGMYVFNANKPNLYFITVAAILCTAFYLTGIWHNSGAGRLSASPCLNISQPQPTHLAKQPALDFRSHHRAEDLPVAAARVPHLPPCAANFSEYTPCEDSTRSLPFERERLVYRERHCPGRDEVLRCRIPAPHGYRTQFRWPESRSAVWYANVPHEWLTVEKKNQNWVRLEGDRFTFPGGGTMFPDGADAYIDDIGKLINLRDGSVRTAIDTGCGVASFGAYLMSRDIQTVSFAPKDTHEAQVQFALERGVPALIGVLASIRLPYPARAFDIAHCSRCLIPWAGYDGAYLVEIDRILRPGGYWVLSGPPINWETRYRGWERKPDDIKAEQSAIEEVTRRLCWKKLVQRGDIAVFQKPTNHIHCKAKQKVYKNFQFCQANDPDTAWYTKMETCLTPLPEVSGSGIKETAGGELANWPERLTSVPPRIRSGNLAGITADKFTEDTEMWRKRVAYYKSLDYQLAENGRYRNLLDMNSHLGGFAAALVGDPVWVMNIVPVEAEINTLGVVYERGLIGTYQNWCEAMSTYPRTYDFIHADSVFTLYKDRCEMEDILLEMDRILRPQGSVIFRDDVDMLVKIKSVIDVMEWESSRIVDHEDGPHEREKILLASKKYWTAPAPGADQSKEQR